jgi:hypothetical protein
VHVKSETAVDDRSFEGVALYGSKRFLRRRRELVSFLIALDQRDVFFFKDESGGFRIGRDYFLRRRHVSQRSVDCVKASLMSGSDQNDS